MIFYTADLHLGYFPILHDTARPFTGVPEMDEALISNWNARVGADDSVYIVGDFSYNGGEAPTQYLSRLNGHLHLIRGNHDTGLNHAERLLDYCDSVTDFLEIDDGGTHILLCHYPILHEKGGYMIHGHIHNQRNHAYEILKTLPRVLNAGVDINFYRPVPLDELVENNRKYYSEEYPELFPVPPRPDRSAPGLMPRTVSVFPRISVDTFLTVTILIRILTSTTFVYLLFAFYSLAAFRCFKTVIQVLKMKQQIIFKTTT